MARRPDRPEVEVLSEENLKEIRYNLAHLSLPAVRDAYERAYQDCRFHLRYSPLTERKHKLRSILPAKNERVFYCDHIEQDGERMLRLACENDLEASSRTASTILTFPTRRAG